MENFKKTPTVEIAKKRTTLINEILKLSLEKEEELYKLNFLTTEKRKEIISNSSMFSIRSKMKEVKYQMNTRLREILDIEQYKIYLKEEENIAKAMSEWIETKSEYYN